MYGQRTFIGIIPARGGSKGLPRKNVRPLCGKPLIAWTIEAGRRSRHLDEVMVTTDDSEIAAVAAGCGAAVPFLRPAELAGDDTPTIAAVRHALAHYRERLRREFDYVVLLEPTSPLREEDDIDSMIATMVGREAEFDAIVSLGEAHEHPSIMKRIDGAALRPYCAELPAGARRQDNPPAYFPYGVAYIVKTAVLLAEGTFYPERTTYHLIRRHQNYEIDDLCDFLAVESIMGHREEWR